MKESGKQTIRFEAGGKCIDVFPASKEDCPVIYLNTFATEGGAVRKELEKLSCPDHTLVAVSSLEWDHDMAPWDIPPISKDDTPCTGGADDYLILLTQEILPRSESFLPGAPSWRGLAGYSLAGLFAVYAMYRTDLFGRIASMSGSLWFPGLLDFVGSHEPLRKPDHLYLSLGDAECKTRNPYLKVVQENTEKLADFYKDTGIDTLFQLNPGNHYQDPARRTALGIAWLLSR